MPYTDGNYQRSSSFKHVYILFGVEPSYYFSLKSQYVRQLCAQCEIMVAIIYLVLSTVWARRVSLHESHNSKPAFRSGSMLVLLSSLIYFVDAKGGKNNSFTSVLPVNAPCPCFYQDTETLLALCLPSPWVNWKTAPRWNTTISNPWSTWSCVPDTRPFSEGPRTMELESRSWTPCSWSWRRSCPQPAAALEPWRSRDR